MDVTSCMRRRGMALRVCIASRPIPGVQASLFLSVPGLAGVWPRSWLADGGLVLTVTRGSSDVVLYESAGRSLRALVETNANEWGGEVSADGHWAAYASDASGRYEIYVTTIEEPRSTVQVSRSGGHGPHLGEDREQSVFSSRQSDSGHDGERGAGNPAQFAREDRGIG